MRSAVFSDFPFPNSLLMTSTMTDFIFFNILILIQEPLQHTRAICLILPRAVFLCFFNLLWLIF